MPTILLTGFEPFDGCAANPSGLIARALDGTRIAGHVVAGVQLPTVFGGAARQLDAAIDTHRPALVLALGLAGGRPAVAIERIAINLDDARIPDNDGCQPVDHPVVAGGPAAYFSTLPVKAMWAALVDAGIAAEVSQTAGTFVCNHVFYALMHRLARDGVPARGGFIHVPWMAGQGEPSLPLATLVHAVHLALSCAVQTEVDCAVGAGALH